MDFNPIKGLSKELEQLYRTLSKRHMFVIEACPATMNGQKGFLGVSRGVYIRVWFDTQEDSKTLFSSLSKSEAIERFKKLCKQYGS